MSNHTLVYIDNTGAVIVEADGQQIEISQESLKQVTIRSCSLLNWKIKPNTDSFESGFVGIANVNHTSNGGVK